MEPAFVSLRGQLSYHYGWRLLRAPTLKSRKLRDPGSVSRLTGYHPASSGAGFFLSLEWPLALNLVSMDDISLLH